MSHSQLAGMLAESGLEPEVFGPLAAALEPLAALADEVPAPSAELRALLGERDPVPPRAVGQMVLSPLGRGSGVAAAALAVALSGMCATGLSAAANTLPSPLQHHVSDFSRRYLPFDFPQPAAQLPDLPRPPHGRKSAPPRDGNGLGQLGVVATDAGRGDPWSRSIAQPRVANEGTDPSGRTPGRSPGRSGHRDEPTENTSLAPGPRDPEQPGSASPAPGRTSSNGTPQPGSTPTGTKTSSGVPVRLVGLGQHPGMGRPELHSWHGGGKNHVHGAEDKPPRGPVPVVSPVTSPADPGTDPPGPPAGNGVPDPDGASGGKQDEPAGGGTTEDLGGAGGESAQPGPVGN